MSKDLDQWQALAAKEARGKDLSRETIEGITLKTVYGPEDAAGIEPGAWDISELRCHSCASSLTTGCGTVL